MNTQDKTLPALEKHCPNCGQQEIRQLADGFKCHECGKEFNDKFIPYTQAGVLNAKADTQDKSTPKSLCIGLTVSRKSDWHPLEHTGHIHVGPSANKGNVCIIVCLGGMDDIEATAKRVVESYNQFEALKAVAEASETGYAQLMNVTNILRGDGTRQQIHDAIERTRGELSRWHKAISVLNQIQNAK